VYRSSIDQEKALEALLYVAHRVGGDLYRTLKVLYLADKEHLRRYGRQIYGENYCAMSMGPTASLAYDTVKDVRENRRYTLGISGADSALTVIGNDYIKPLRQPDFDELSKSDIRVLTEIADEHGDQSFGEVMKATHDEAWEATALNQLMARDTIASSLDNGTELVHHLNDRFPGDVAEEDEQSDS